VSNQPGAGKTIELLDNLKRTVSQGAANEEKLKQEFRVRMATARRHCDEAVEQESARLAAALEKAEASFQAARAVAEAASERRRARIRQAGAALAKRLGEEIESKEGHGNYRLQSETLQAKRDHEEGLATAERNFEDFKRQLAEDHQAFDLLEVRAQESFRGYKRLFRRLSKLAETAEPDLSADEHQLIAQFRELVTRSQAELGRFRRSPLPWLFNHPWLWAFLLASPMVLVPFRESAGLPPSFSYGQAAGAMAALLVVGVLLYFLGRRQTQPAARGVTDALARARRMLAACAEKSATRHQQEIERVENDFQTCSRNMAEEWNRTLAEVAEMRESWAKLIEAKEAQIAARQDARRRRRLAQLEGAHQEVVQRLQNEAGTRIKALQDRTADKERRLLAEQETRFQALEAEWQAHVQPMHQAIQAAQAAAQALFPEWRPELWKDWMPPAAFSHAAPFGRIEVDVAKLAGALPQDKRLAWPGPARFPLPLLLSYPDQGSILFETGQAGHDEAIAALNNIMLRLLSTAPAGRLSFTVIDPVGLGQSFSGVMHLADYAEHLINSRIWTQASQIEQRLADLNEHMEKVIQMYLRNEYQTIAEYNKQAGNIAEKYHFLVVADFPAGFSEVAAKRLMSIAASGARCGVYTLIHWDQRQPRPQDFVPEDLRRSSVCLTGKGKEFHLAGQPVPGTSLLLEAPPAADFASEFVQRVGRISIDSNRIEVPFAHVAPEEGAVWSLDTTSELRVPIGRTGATKLQYLAIGKDTRQHALVAGKTGSGKSTLFHVIITNLAMWCSPEQVEFYLVDFKKGVEFKCYASRRLPHARVVAIESDREFGLSVLQRVDAELQRRGEMFRKFGIQDIAGYKRAGGTDPIPRSLLLIDEFQELFVEDDKIAQTASLLLDRIVRQGRAFGIHVVLGSQTLGGAYTVARTTLGQMVIRVALQCNEADAYLIMDDNNPAPRLLSRPGEGIYNDTAGTIEGNSPFQVVWLPDEVRDSYLARVRDRAEQSPGRYPGPIVFEGDAAGDVRENPLLQGLLEAEALKQSAAPRIWLGAPNSIKGPTEAVFHRQSGNNLIVIGQRDETTLALLSIALVSLAAQHPRGSVRFILLDSTPPGSPQRDFLEQVVQAIPHPVTLAKQGDLGEIMTGLAEDMKLRAEDEHAAEAPRTFLLIHGLQKYNRLRHEEDFSFSADEGGAPAKPSALLNNLICEGTRLGFHVIATCDTYNNVNRFLSRKALSEFGMRVLFQMSANDSASLIDNPKASTLGLHRALFFNEQEVYLETFRPYALPDRAWVEQAARQLKRLVG
jgi:DNA segregation ATPase FtsK/SpoIIIE, S-DNA-T family